MSKFIAGLALALGMIGAVSVYAANRLGGGDCCAQVRDCCNPPQACCLPDCCAENRPCCDPPSECCIPKTDETK